MNRGDIVLVDFPYPDLTGSKLRPALVVLADTYNRKLTQSVFALITSSRKRMVGDPTQLLIDPSTPNGQSTGLRLPSAVLCENLMTLRQSHVRVILGQLSTASLLQINACLKAALDLA